MNATGVVYTPGVCRGQTMPSEHTFLGALYRPAWVFSLCSFTCQGRGKPRVADGQMRIPRFLYVATEIALLTILALGYQLEGYCRLLMFFEPSSDIKAIAKKASLYRKISQDSVDLFRKEIKTYFDFLDDHQTEETQKGFVKTFLEHTYYKENYLIVGDENRKDLAILGAYDTSAKTNVFIETKSTTSDEMVRKEDLRAKAFYETILYYMNERDNRNDELKHIVITNMKEWCIIDALDYDRLFWRDNGFKKKYEQFKKGQLSFRTTDQFYENVAAPFVEGSLIENAIEQIKSASISYLPVEGDTEEERIFNAALQLSIVWVNRLLFLKLLEAQLLLYNDNDESFKFLNSDNLKTYNDLDTLFFRVLSVPEENRTSSLKDKYPHVPYLNSSLFEVSRQKQHATRLSVLDSNAKLPLFPGSVLKKYVKHTKRNLSSLEYLLLFLDSYDFGADKKTDDTIDSDAKPLISASVLGLIFEKINGYKDGSIFTPSKITMTLCRETLRRAVVDKFNKEKGWSCSSFEDLYNRIDDKTEANSIINSLRICDPAVGSGHFLVSALNELITIKSELGIITDSAGKRLRDYHIDVQNDELIITDEVGEQVVYQRSVHYTESQRLQEVIFNEKRTIIENCLFGVDINPNSVNICRLRLWIELLKSTYYDRNSGLLQTLPNIDINIKCGNSLVSKFQIVLNEPIKLPSDLARKLRSSISTYKSLVAYLKDNLIECDFNTSDFWYILQPMDQRIRNQVMKTGKHPKNRYWRFFG